MPRVSPSFDFSGLVTSLSEYTIKLERAIEAIRNDISRELNITQSKDRLITNITGIVKRHISHLVKFIEVEFNENSPKGYREFFVNIFPLELETIVICVKIKMDKKDIYIPWYDGGDDGG